MLRNKKKKEVSFARPHAHTSLKIRDSKKGCDGLEEGIRRKKTLWSKSLKGKYYETYNSLRCFESGLGSRGSD